MKNEISVPVAGAALAAIVLVIVLAWFLFNPGASRARNAAAINEVAHRLGQAHGDVSKLSSDDQAFIKSHPRSFSTGASGGNRTARPVLLQ
jgi:ammonia channel protein AmtB